MSSGLFRTPFEQSFLNEVTANPYNQEELLLYVLHLSTISTEVVYRYSGTIIREYGGLDRYLRFKTRY